MLNNLKMLTFQKAFCFEILNLSVIKDSTLSPYTFYPILFVNFSHNHDAVFKIKKLTLV